MGDDPIDARRSGGTKLWVGLLALLMGASATLLLLLRSRLGFISDDWWLVVYRTGDGIGNYLDPHNEHIIVLPTAVYKASLAIFGMNAMPIHVVGVATFLVSVGLLFVWVRSELDDFFALIACAVVLFLGSSADDLLWAFQIGYIGSMAAGIGGLLAARSETRKGDFVATALLTTSILFSSLGIPFVVAAFVAVALQNRSRGAGALARRIWVVALPALVYAAWWLGWGQTAENSMTLENAVKTPEYVVSSFGLVIGELTGLYRPLHLISHRLDLVLGLLGIAGVAVVLWKRRKVPDHFYVAMTALLAFWILAGLNVMPGREYSAARYQYPAVVMALMMLSAVFGGSKPGPVWRYGLAAVAVFAIAVNLSSLRDGYRESLLPSYESNNALVTAFEIGRGTIDPHAAIEVVENGSGKLGAGPWYAAADRYGSIAWTESEIPEQTAEARSRIDEVLIRALPVTGTSVAPGESGSALAGTCRTVMASTTGSPEVDVRGDSVTIRPKKLTVVAAGRFGDETRPIGFGAAGETMMYSFPPDRSDRPWRIAFSGEAGPVRVCTGFISPSS